MDTESQDYSEACIYSDPVYKWLNSVFIEA